MAAKISIWWTRTNLSIGAYPAVTIKMARDAREQAKTMLATGIDPSQAKQASKLKEKEATLGSGRPISWPRIPTAFRRCNSRANSASAPTSRRGCCEIAPGHGHAQPRALSGVAEVDETELPLRAKDDPVTGASGQRTRQNARRWRGRGRRWRPGTHSSRENPRLLRQIAARLRRREHVARRTIKTDGWSAYPGAPGVAHDPHVIGKMAAHVVLPWVHRVFANVKTWALGVYHGLREKHLQSYLDEFVFRFNRRQNPS